MSPIQTSVSHLRHLPAICVSLLPTDIRSAHGNPQPPSFIVRSDHPPLDAHVLFEAVRLGHLPMIRRRLTGTERSALQSGDVFVWEEASHKGGLERWTDGRKWCVSSVCPSPKPNLSLTHLKVSFENA